MLSISHLLTCSLVRLSDESINQPKFNVKNQNLSKTGNPTSPASPLLLPIFIKLPHNQMNKKVNIDPECAPKKLQKLGIVELSLQQIVQGNLSARPGDRNRPVAPLDTKHPDLITRNRQVDLSPLALAVPAP